MDWPQWRGPFFNGSTTETGLPSAWTPSSNVVWATALPGPSSATPVVAGDRVFLTSTDPASKQVLGFCISVNDGRILWQQPLGPDRAANGGNNMAAPSPVTDGKSVWFLTGTGMLTACRVDGQRLWQRDLAADYGELVVKYGYSSSPLLWEGKLYVPVLQNRDARRYNKQAPERPALDSFLLALEAATGKTLWQQIRPTNAEDESTEGYSTPLPVTVAGRREVVLVGGECVTGHDAVTGAETWRWWFTPGDRKIWQRVVVSPVLVDDLLVVVRPKHRPVFAIKLGGQGKLGDEILAWEHKDATPDVPTPLVYHDRLYLLDDTKKILTCCEPKTGRVIWAEKLPTTSGYYASPTGADGKVYCVSRTGEVVVVAAADQYRVLATINLGEGPCHSSPVVATGRLFFRTGQKLYCVGDQTVTSRR